MVQVGRPWRDVVQYLLVHIGDAKPLRRAQEFVDPCAQHRHGGRTQVDIKLAHGFYARALHEIAHWLVAGERRRELEDYGYWYCPDGRSTEQQHEFENVEIKPQAIEWALSAAAGFDFNVSVDNLNGEQTCRFSFQKRVQAQVFELLDKGFNIRTEELLKALSDFYKTPWPLTEAQFDWQCPEEFLDAV